MFLLIKDISTLRYVFHLLSNNFLNFKKYCGFFYSRVDETYKVAGFSN